MNGDGANQVSVMEKREREELAKYFGVAPELVPYIPELLADIWVLGSWPERIIALLRPLDLPLKSTKVLDLGCGKGAVSILVAKELGFKVTGIDLFPPFIQEARTRAREYGIEDLCRFEIGDMLDKLPTSRNFDIIIFASVGGVLGDFAVTVEQLRQGVRPGGYMIIDDGFLSHKSRLNRDSYGHYRSHDVTIRQLTEHSDILVKEELIPVKDLKAFNQRTTEDIRKRADALAKLHPELADACADYVQWEETESRILETETIPAIWLIQKN